MVSNRSASIGEENEVLLKTCSVCQKRIRIDVSSMLVYQIHFYGDICEVRREKTLFFAERRGRGSESERARERDDPVEPLTCLICFLYTSENEYFYLSNHSIR